MHTEAYECDVLLHWHTSSSSPRNQHPLSVSLFAIAVVIVWSCFRMAKFITHSTLGYQYFYVRSSITIIIIVVINISISRDIVIAIICFLGEMIFELALSRFSIFCGRRTWTLRNVASKWQKVASNLGNPNTCSHPRIHTSGKLNLRISQDYKDFLLLLSRFHPSLIHAQMEV